jgi:dephospho-CoA kinase
MESFKEGVMVVVIPLLVEKELWGPFDRAVVVDCDVETQLDRLTARENIDNTQAKTMLMAQASREQRFQLADHLPTDIIDNNSKISDLKEHVEKLSQKLFALI